MKILIAVDGSSYTKRMLAYLAAHDEWLGAKHEYTVLHGVLAVPPRAASFVSHKVVTDFYESEAEAVLSPIRAFFKQQGIPATFAYAVGHVADAIAERAVADKSDLIIMGFGPWRGRQFRAGLGRHQGACQDNRAGAADPLISAKSTNVRWHPARKGAAEWWHPPKDRGV